MAAKGDRVLAVSHTKDGNVYVFGEGVYVGNEVPGPEAAGLIAEMCRGAERANPKIKLDCGDVVWGCECWWGELEAAVKRFEGMEIVTIDLEKSRERSRTTGG